jgi:beta-lactamase class A
MDYEARSRGLENRISARDCVRLLELRDVLTLNERAWIELMLLANDDLGLLLRNIPRDIVAFYHKTGSIPGLLHDWGYTEKADVFLLTQNVKDVGTTYEVFGRIGEMVLPET